MSPMARFWAAAGPGLDLYTVGTDINRKGRTILDLARRRRRRVASIPPRTGH
jgi:hypothetical protein